MAFPTDLATQQLITFPRASIAALRTALRRDTGGAYATYLQEAGYAGGETLFAAFRDWLAARGADTPDALPVDAFGIQAGAFFGDSGWGRIDVKSVRDVAASVECPDWAEADPNARLEQPGCHFSAGLFADFFGRVAGSPLAVLEVECRSCGAEQCRFIVGSADVMQHVYDRVTAGADYTGALNELA
jgi:predicted hydrocarbon binding protein